MRQKMGPLHWIGFVLILVWCLLPIAWIISLSFKSLTETTVGSPQFLPKHATWDNYKTLLNWNDPTGHDFLRALINSFGISLSSPLLAVIFATLAAYAIARLDFVGKKL